MTSELPPGVLIHIKQIKERCGNCNEPFSMETYLEPLTEQRYYRVLCKTCNYAIPTGGDR